MGNRSLLATAAALLLLLAFASAQRTRGAESSPPTFSGNDWEEALDKVPCELIKANKDGTRTIDGILAVGKEQKRNPTISDLNGLSIIESHCHVCPQSLKTLGIAC